MQRQLFPGLGLAMAACAVAIGALFTSVAMAQDASFNPLGDLAGGTFDSVPLGISDDGSTVVGWSSSANGMEAFRWTSTGGMVGLGDLAGGSFESEAFATSADGTTVVGYGTIFDGFDDRWEAFIWTEAGNTLTPLGFIDGAGDSVAHDVSADGTEVVGWSTSSFSTSQAFLWTQGTGMIGLGFLPGSGFGSESNAVAISADGSTVVGNNYDTTTGYIEAMKWTLADGMVRIGSLTGGTQRSFANGVSADGSTIVGYANSDNGIQEAFRWTEATGMVGLGDLPGGIFDSGAYGVSADGTVVVGWGQDAAGTEAMRWTEVGGMRSIAELLTVGGIDLTGWSLELATDISADGEVIVGVGTNPGGDEEAWIARLGSGLITPNGVITSIGTVTPGVVDIERGLQNVADGVIEACLAHRGEDLTKSLCPYFVGDGSVLVDDPAGAAGSATAGLALRNEDGFRIGAGPAVIGGWTSLDGGGNSSFWGYGVGAFAAYGRPNAGPQFALAGTFFDLHADIDRAYMNGSSTDISSGSTDGLGGSAEVEFGMRFAAGEMASFMPYTNLRASYLRLDGYTETGGGFPAEIDPMEAARTTLRLGLEGRFGVSPSCEFVAKAAWGHDLVVDGPDISGNIIGVFDFAVPGAAVASDFVEVSLGTSWVTDAAHVATTLGGIIGTDGSSPAIFGRITINR